MYQVVRKVKQLGDWYPSRVPVKDTEHRDFFTVLSLAGTHAKEHAEDIVVGSPYRHDNGFHFWTSNNSKVSYVVEEVGNGQIQDHHLQREHQQFE